MIHKKPTPLSWVQVLARITLWLIYFMITTICQSKTSWRKWWCGWALFWTEANPHCLLEQCLKIIKGKNHFKALTSVGFENSKHYSQNFLFTCFLFSMRDLLCGYQINVLQLLNYVILNIIDNIRLLWEKNSVSSKCVCSDFYAIMIPKVSLKTFKPFFESRFLSQDSLHCFIRQIVWIVIYICLFVLV